MIELADELSFAGEAENCTQVATDMEVAQPHLVLMDIHMPEADGLQGLRYIRTHFPNIKVLMQTVFDDSDMVFESIRNGANGYVLKKDSPQRLVEAIKEIYLGGAFMNPGIAQKILKFFLPQAKNTQLSVREKEVLKLLADGYSYKMTAAQLGLSYHTINAHVKNIYDKLHVQSLGEAIAYYYKHFDT